MKLFFFSLLQLFISSKSYSIDVQDTIENTILNNPKIKIGLEKFLILRIKNGKIFY